MAEEGASSASPPASPPRGSCLPPTHCPLLPPSKKHTQLALWTVTQVSYARQSLIHGLFRLWCLPAGSYLRYIPLGHINFCHRGEIGQWNLNGLFLFIDTISWQEQFSELIFHSIESHVTANEYIPRSVQWQNTVVSALCFIWIKSSGYYQI